MPKIFWGEETWELLWGKITWTSMLGVWKKARKYYWKRPILIFDFQKHWERTHFNLLFFGNLQVIGSFYLNTFWIEWLEHGGNNKNLWDDYFVWIGIYMDLTWQIFFCFVKSLKIENFLIRSIKRQKFAKLSKRKIFWCQQEKNFSRKSLNFFFLLQE